MDVNVVYKLSVCYNEGENAHRVNSDSQAGRGALSLNHIRAQSCNLN